MRLQEGTPNREAQPAGPSEEPHTASPCPLGNLQNHSILSPNSIHFTSILQVVVLRVTDMQVRAWGGDIRTDKQRGPALTLLWSYNRNGLFTHFELFALLSSACYRGSGQRRAQYKKTPVTAKTAPWLWIRNHKL